MLETKGHSIFPSLSRPANMAQKQPPPKNAPVFRLTPLKLHCPPQYTIEASATEVSLMEGELIVHSQLFLNSELALMDHREAIAHKKSFQPYWFHRMLENVPSNCSHIFQIGLGLGAIMHALQYRKHIACPRLRSFPNLKQVSGIDISGELVNNLATRPIVQLDSVREWLFPVSLVCGSCFEPSAFDEVSNGSSADVLIYDATPMNTDTAVGAICLAITKLPHLRVIIQNVFIASKHSKHAITVEHVKESWARAEKHTAFTIATIVRVAVNQCVCVLVRKPLRASKERASTASKTDGTWS